MCVLHISNGDCGVGYPVIDNSVNADCHRVFGKDLESSTICVMLEHSKFMHNTQAYIILAL